MEQRAKIQEIHLNMTDQVVEELQKRRLAQKKTKTPPTQTKNTPPLSKAGQLYSSIKSFSPNNTKDNNQQQK